MDCLFDGYSYAGLSCSYVCNCNYVYRSYANCHRFAPHGSASGPYTHDVYSGEIIKADFFNSLVHDFNRISSDLNIWYHLNLYVRPGETIKASDLERIPEKINDALNSGIIGDCNSYIVSNPVLDHYWIQEGKKIYANDWNRVIRYLSYIASCCNCNSDYVLVCGDVCVCNCFY